MTNTTFSNASHSTVERREVERLTTRQIADELKLTNQTIRNYIRIGLNGIILRSYKRGSKRFIMRDDLDKFLEQTTTEGFEEKPRERTPAQFKKDLKKAQKIWDRFSGN